MMPSINFSLSTLLLASSLQDAGMGMDNSVSFSVSQFPNLTLFSSLLSVLRVKDFTSLEFSLSQVLRGGKCTGHFMYIFLQRINLILRNIANISSTLKCYFPDMPSHVHLF